LYESTNTIGSARTNAAGNAGAGTSVAVLDTGVLSSHVFLSGQVVAQACFSTTNSGQLSTSLCPGGVAQTFGTGAAEPCADICNHGTHVAGIVAGKQLTYGGRTFSGVAPAAKIIAVQVFSRFTASGCGVGATAACVMSYQSDQILALNWLYAQRASADWGTLAAVNMSLGSGLNTGITSCNDDLLKAPIDTLRTAGIATVIASGNDGYTYGIASPACISTAIAVGATSSARTATLDAPWVSSNKPTALNNNPTAQGDRLLDLMAPGHKVLSSTASSSTSFEDNQGTSMAAPHVAGAWAVLKSMVPRASVPKVLGWLQSSGKTIIDSRGGDPLAIARIDVAAAASLAATEALITPSTTPTKTKTATKTRTSTRTQTRNPRRTATKTRTRTRTLTRTITATPTATATQTLTPSVTLTATALPAWATSVTNGNFEAGAAHTGWTMSTTGTTLVSRAYSRYLPRSGTYFMYLGGMADETSILGTTLTIPAEATYLRMYTYVYSPETVCGNDVATVKLNNVLVGTIPLCYATNTILGYIPFSIDVTALRGQSGIPLEIKAVTNSSSTSHFLVDDVGYVSAPTDMIFRLPLGVFDQYYHSVEDVPRP
jgi:subtilisin family serine protease